MPSTHLLNFDGVSRPVALHDSPKLFDCLPHVFKSWPYDLLDADGDHGEPIISVRRDTEGYHLSSPWLIGNPLTQHEIDAACAIVVDLVAAHLDDCPMQLCIHAGAVEFHGHLIVFPNKYRAGKSLLCSALASRGFRIFSDDLLKVDTGVSDRQLKGLATGVAPRLRLPLPKGMGALTDDFVASRWGAASERYLYLDLTDAELAPYNTPLPMAGFVLLDREPGAAASLEPVSANEMLSRVIWQNFARGQNAEDILAQLHELVETSHRFRIRYDDLDDAVELLAREFSPDRVKSPFLRNKNVFRGVECTPIITYAAEPSSNYFQKSPGLREREVNGDCFLADANGQAIHQLNATGAMIWRLYTEPMQHAEAVGIMRMAFPDEPTDALERDTDTVVKALVKKGLLRAVDPDKPAKISSDDDPA
ncbi:MAG: PqqD family protein [Hyphomicrobiaceae bacterium]